MAILALEAVYRVFKVGIKLALCPSILRDRVSGKGVKVMPRDALLETSGEELFSKSEKTRHHKIGEVLLRRGQIRVLQLDFMLQLQKAYKSVGKDVKFGDLLIAHRMITLNALNEALVVQAEIPKESITKIIEAINDFPSKITSVLSPDQLKTQKAF